MLKSVTNRNIVLACIADCPADNHARPLAQFLYGTSPIISKKYDNEKFSLLILTYIAVSCSKKDICESADCLPVLTAEGTGNIACLIDGKAFTAGGSQFGGPTQQAYYNTLNGHYYFGLKGTSSKTNQLIIFANKVEIQEGRTYSLEKESDSSFYANYILNGGQKQYRTSDIHNGEITFSKFDKVNGIVSGTFLFDAINEEGEVVEIRASRFDMKYN